MKQKQTISKVLTYIKDYKFYLIGSVVFALITVAFTLYIPILIGNAIDCIIKAGNVDFDSMFRIFTKTAVMAVIAALSQWIMNLLNNKMTYYVSRDIRNKAIEKMPVIEELLKEVYADDLAMSKDLIEARSAVTVAYIVLNEDIENAKNNAN